MAVDLLQSAFVFIKISGSKSQIIDNYFIENSDTNLSQYMLILY